MGLSKKSFIRKGPIFFGQLIKHNERQLLQSQGEWIVMNLLVLFMGYIRQSSDVANITGLNYANINKIFERVFVLMPPFPGNKSEVFLLENETHIYNVGYNKFLSTLNYIKLIIKALSINKQYNLDILHSYNPHFCGLMGVILKKILKKPLIISVHSDLETIFSKGMMRYLFRSKILTENITRISLRNADQIWVQAEHMKEYIQKHFLIDSGKFRKIKILIDKENFPIVRERSLHEHHFRTIIFIGRLDPQKNVFSLLKAYKILDKRNGKVKLLIIGDGTQREALLEFKESNHLENVVFLGGLDNKNIRPYLLQSDCFVHPGGLGE